MWVEDDELKIFCDLLSEVYIENYIEPSNEWTKLPITELEKEFHRFKRKKLQAEKEKDPIQKTAQPLHFWFKESGAIDDAMFQQMAEFLMPRGVIRNNMDLKKAYLALRWMLEDHGCYISSNIHTKVKAAGIMINSSRITEREKKHIAIQAMAQVIAYYNGYFNIKKIKTVILEIDSEIGNYLYLDQWKSARDYDESVDGFEPKDRAKKLERLIASINPIPGSQMGRTPKTPKLSTEIRHIPGIFEEINGMTKIHFGKLKIAVTYLALSLGLCYDSYNEMMEHPIILKYCNRLPILFRGFLKSSVEEGLKVAEFLNR
jgi:hypothetical protein